MSITADQIRDRNIGVAHQIDPPPIGSPCCLWSMRNARADGNAFFTPRLGKTAGVVVGHHQEHAGADVLAKVMLFHADGKFGLHQQPVPFSTVPADGYAVAVKPQA